MKKKLIELRKFWECDIKNTEPKKYQEAIDFVNDKANSAADYFDNAIWWSNTTKEEKFFTRLVFLDLLIIWED